MYGILLWDSDLYGEDSYITRNGMHGIACITGQEIVLLHHCELNASPTIESSSNAATLHVHTNDRQQLHQPITCMLFQNDAVTAATDATGETKDDRGGGGITVNGSDIHEEEKMMMMMQLNNVFTLGCTVRSGSSTAVVELQGFPWWKSDARFRVNHKRNNNDCVVVPPLHNSTNQNSSNNCSNSDSIGSNEDCYRNGYAQTSSAVDTASHSYSSSPILLQLPQSSITSNSMVTIGDESIAIINGTYTNGASLLNGQSSHKLDTIRVDSIAAAPMRRPKQSRKTCENEDDNGLVKTSKGIVAQKKSKKRMRLQ